MSTPTIRTAIREVMKDHPDGLTAQEIAFLIGRNESSVIHSLRGDDLMYVDRWTESKKEPQWIAVWCFHPPFVDPPKPSMTPRQYRESLELSRV